MILDWVGTLAKITNLLLHLLTMFYIGRQFFFPYPFPAWRQAWGYLFFAMACILVFRIDDLFQPVTYWRMLLGLPMTTALFCGFRLKAQIYQRIWGLGQAPIPALSPVELACMQQTDRYRVFLYLLLSVLFFGGLIMARVYVRQEQVLGRLQRVETGADHVLQRMDAVEFLLREHMQND